MSLTTKVTIITSALKKVNKKGLLKKVYRLIKDGGLKALKGAIIQTAIRDCNAKERNLKFENNYYLEQQAIKIENAHTFSKNITVIIFVSENQIFFDDTLKSILTQKYVDNVDIQFVLPESYTDHYNLSYKVYLQNQSTMTEIILGIAGDYFMLIKAGNVLAPNALYQFMKELDKGYSCVYSDECIWNFDNNTITRHYLKPDFSEYYMYNNLYTEQSVCFSSKDLFKTCEIQNNLTDVSALINEGVLRLAENKKKISHLEKILLLRHYHFELQTNINHNANIELIRKRLKKMDVQINSFNEGRFKNYCNAIVHQNLSASIIISSNNSNYAINLINSIFNDTKYFNFEVIVAANYETCTLIQHNVVARENLIYNIINEYTSYTAGCNAGFEIASGEIIIFMQDDLIIKDRFWLDEIMKCFSIPFIGGVSPKVLRADNTIRYAGAISGGFDLCPIYLNGEFNEVIEDFSELAFISRETSILSASCIAVRNNILLQTGCFNTLDTPDKFSNADLSFKISEQGYQCIFCSSSIVYSSGEKWYDSWFDKPSKTGYIYMIKNWIHRLTDDPYFSNMMKRHILNRLPFDIKFYSSKSNSKNIQTMNMVKQRNVLLITHELTLTGAPIALHYAAKAILDNGDYPVIISPQDGNLRETIIQDGIPVLVNPTIFSDGYWIKLAEGFDLVIVCTLACYGAVKFLEEASIPTLWWAHEARESYEGGMLKNSLPQNINENINMYCGGEYARKMLYTYRPNYTADVLLYAVPDFANMESETNFVIPDIQNKIVFSIIGSIMKRKGQDILAKAIIDMPADEVKKCRFIFIGKMIDAEIYLKVNELKSKYPNEVILIDEVSREELMEVYKVSHSIICASRDDPMPIFMTEAMMFSNICICSENTGTAALIKDGMNGFVYNNNDPKQLMQKIMWVIDNINNLEHLKIKGRETYESNFTMESFSNQLVSVIDSVIKKGG